MKKMCVYCGKEFECYDKRRKGKRGGRTGYKRKVNAITCSSKCSRRYGVERQKNPRRIF